MERAFFLFDAPQISYAYRLEGCQYLRLSEGIIPMRDSPSPHPCAEGFPSMRESKPSLSARAFFSGLVDYAGLFPPAGLDLIEAVGNYRTYLDRPERWILSRFIATAAHVEQLREESLRMFTAQHPLAVSLVSRDPASDITRVVAKLKQSEGRVAIGSAEVVIDCNKDLAQQLSAHDSILKELDSSGLHIPLFYEVPPTESWDKVFDQVVDAIDMARTHTARMIGCKLRCGGLQPQLIPPPDRIAHVLHGCASRSIPLKCTAGLHQPFRHADHLDGKPVMTHGYFNVFFAGIVANTQRASVEELLAIVSESDVVDAVFSDEGISWLGRTISTEEIQRAREERVISYGSCSFEEPIEAAMALGWL
jgi:hypothetical protein